MRLTVTTLADEIFTFEVSEDMELESFRALCEIETGISAREIVVFWNGRPLHDNRRMFCIFFTLVRTGLGLDVRLGSLPMFVFIRPTLQIIVTLDSQSQVIRVRCEVRITAYVCVYKANITNYSHT